VRGRIRITEQGEVISSRYSEPEFAHRHLQQLLHAMICSTGSRPEFDQIDEWSVVMDEVSEMAYQKYRSLVEHPDFLNYFQTASPIDRIGQMNIGSRPTHRRATQTLDDLRAIPWVFAWTQSRADIPSWFGVGSGFEHWLAEGDREQRMQVLIDMYQQWPFFRTLLNHVHLGMGRADMSIAELYAKLAGDPVGSNIFGEIVSEFELSRKLLLEITGCKQLLDTEPWLQHSIRVRNPYVDPMNFIQVALLEELRNQPDHGQFDLMQKAILQSINGIAAGLQNVG
jgi:phosphoenolpyruvate carboxylase